MAFLEGTIAAPFAFADKMLPNGVITRESEVSFWEATIRYIVSSTIGCYFVKPEKTPVNTFGGGSFGGDGDSLGVLRPTEEKLCFPAIPISLPYMESFRTVTNTEGVDLKALTYREMCTKDGVMQTTADVLDGIGLNAPDTNPFSPNAAILRSAEAVDAVLNSARSGYAETRRESGGMILCSMVQLGGIIYVGFLLIVVFVLLSCLPLINLLTRTLFDLTVAACTSATAGGDRKKAGKGLATAIKAQVAKQVQAAMSGTMGGMPRMPTGAAVATRGVTWGDAVSNVHITGTDTNGNAIYSAQGNGTHQHHNPELTAAKMRSVLKKHRSARKNAPPPAAPKPVVTTAVASLVEDVRGGRASSASVPRSAPVCWTRERPTTGVRIFEGVVFLNENALCPTAVALAHAC